MGAAKRILGIKKSKSVKKQKRGKGVKVKLKVKGSPDGVTRAVRKLAAGIG